jgi:hypothetical protein
LAKAFSMCHLRSFSFSAGYRPLMIGIFQEGRVHSDPLLSLV